MGPCLQSQIQNKENMLPKLELTHEYLMSLPNIKLKTIFSEHGIIVKGGLTPAVKKIKIRKLLESLNDPSSEQQQQPAPKINAVPPVKLAPISSNKINSSFISPLLKNKIAASESALNPSLNKDANSFYAIQLPVI